MKGECFDVFIQSESFESEIYPCWHVIPGLFTLHSKTWFTHVSTALFNANQMCFCQVLCKVVWRTDAYLGPTWLAATLFTMPQEITVFFFSYQLPSARTQPYLANCNGWPIYLQPKRPRMLEMHIRIWKLRLLKSTKMNALSQTGRAHAPWHKILWLCTGMRQEIMVDIGQYKHSTYTFAIH